MTIGPQEYVALPLMTIGETARYLGVGRRIVYQLIELAEIRAVKSKGRVLIEKASVDAYRASGKLI
jgi:excisionase family DNA binding protein